MLARLLGKGADVTVNDKQSETALDLAREFDQQEAVKILEQA